MILPFGSSPRVLFFFFSSRLPFSLAQLDNARNSRLAAPTIQSLSLPFPLVPVFFFASSLLFRVYGIDVRNKQSLNLPYVGRLCERRRAIEQPLYDR